MLLRCILGKLPWSAKMKPHPGESWQQGGVRVARDKLRFLEEGGTKKFAPERLATKRAFVHPAFSPKVVV